MPTNSLRSFAVQIIEYMRVLRNFFACFSLSFIFLFASCASLVGTQLSAEDEAFLYPLDSYLPEKFHWQEISDEEGTVPGVWRFDFKSKNPKHPLIYHAVKIELSAEDGANRGKFTLTSSQWKRTLEFAAEKKCIVAMNATPFGRKNLAGIYKISGKVLSEPVERYAALGFNFDQDGKVLSACVFESQKDEKLLECDAAFGGFFVVLKEGKVCTDFVRRYTSRSGAGVSSDGKILYLLLVEGERPWHSIGLSYPQCGQIFRAMGCTDALEFDGGDSSELCINGKSVLSYKVRRVQGNSFGFLYY